MQQYSTATSGSTQLYEDSSCYFSSTRADAFNSMMNPVTDQDQQGSDDHLNGSGFLTMDDCQLMKAAGLLNPNSLMMAGPDSNNAINNPAGESNMSCTNNTNNILMGHHMITQLEFDLDDNGHDQLFHDMLVQQQSQLMQQGSHSQNLVQMQQQEAAVAATASATSPNNNSQAQQQQLTAASNWEESIHVLQEMLLLQQHPALIQMSNINGGTTDHLPAQLASNINNSTLINPNSPLSNSNQFNNLKLPSSESDHLLSLLQLPRCASSSMQQTAAINPDLIRKQAGLIPLYNTNLGAGGSDLHAFYPNPPVNYHDPHLTNLHPQPPQPLPSSLSYPLSLKQLLHNVPTSNQSAASGLIHHLNEGSEEASVMKEAAGMNMPNNNMNTNTNNPEEGRQFPGSLFDFKRENAKGDAKGINHFATERQRREYLNEKYQTLRALVPNPTKADRASIVQDAIEYVKELKRTVQELQILVQEKGRSAQLKRRKLSGDIGNAPDMESSSQATAIDRSIHGTKIIGGGGGANGGINDHIVGGLHLLRSSLLQRTSPHGTQVDVRIVEEEVNIKLTQKRRRNCLLDVVVVLHELHLDLLNANGATIGDHHIFMLNTKIMEGSSTYAGQVATKLIEAVDRPFCTNYLSTY